MNTKKLDFDKKLRLTSSQEFKYVFKNAYKITIKEVIAFSNINNLDFPRIGIIIAKKHVKHAYKRNHIKRLIRESFRIHQHILPKMDFVITIQKKIINLNHKSIKKTLKNIWRYTYDGNFKIINKTNTHVSNTCKSLVQ